jgi:hypothetical protein
MFWSPNLDDHDVIDDTCVVAGNTVFLVTLSATFAMQCISFLKYTRRDFAI